MREIRSDDARQNWRDLLNEVEHDGEHVTILRYNRPAAVIVPKDWYEQAVQMTRGTTVSDFILACIADDGSIATMPVSDRDQFQRGVTTAEAWEAMSEAERAELAASSVGPDQIRRREQARRGPSAAFRKTHKPLGEWMNGPALEYEGRGDGVIEWERTAVAGVWKPTKRNITVTQRWHDDSNDWIQDVRPAPVAGQPRHPLRRTLAEAEADAAALRASAPVVTPGMVAELAAAGDGAVLVLVNGAVRVETGEPSGTVITRASAHDFSDDHAGWASDLTGEVLALI